MHILPFPRTSRPLQKTETGERFYKRVDPKILKAKKDFKKIRMRVLYFFLSASYNIIIDYKKLYIISL